MTQEDKQLLLKDLCARLPYGVHIGCKEGDVYGEIILWKITDSRINDLYDIYCCKPYLRPMSSMTEEEYKEYDSRRKHICDEYNRYCFDTVESIDWLNEHHFDYRLIEKGLALEAPEGMYKNE